LLTDSPCLRYGAICLMPGILLANVMQTCVDHRVLSLRRSVVRD